MPNQAISLDAPLKQATTVNVPPAGVTFDSPTTTATTVDLSQSAQPSQPSPSPSQQQSNLATISAQPVPHGALDHVQRWANDVADDIRYGTDRTGIGGLLKSLGANGVYNGNDPRVGDFMASLPLGVLKVIKGAAELPQSGKRWQGTKDTLGGALQASTIPAGVAAPEEAELASAGIDRAGEAVASGAGKTANVARKTFSLKAVQDALSTAKEGVQQELQGKLQTIQDAWHGSLRDLFDSVAKEAGVQPEPAESLRDVAANTAAAVKAKASAIYQKIDNAIGGGTRIQTFDEQIGNAKRALRNSAGIDPDADGRLVERINSLSDAKQAALDQAKANGVDADHLLKTANGIHHQASALEDLSKQIQASTTGLRGDLAQGVNAAQETVSPAKLSAGANRMYNTKNRLQWALGQSHADELLRTLESTKQSLQDAAENAVRQTEGATNEAAQRTAAVKRNQILTTAAAGSVGAGTLWAKLKHLLGE